MTALALSPTELQSLINRGIVSIRPPDNQNAKSLESKVWRELNREKYRESRKRNYERNRERIRARAKELYALNREKIKAADRARYAKKCQEKLEAEGVTA